MAEKVRDTTCPACGDHGASYQQGKRRLYIHCPNCGHHNFQKAEGQEWLKKRLQAEIDGEQPESLEDSGIPESTKQYVRKYVQKVEPESSESEPEPEKPEPKVEPVKKSNKAGKVAIAACLAIGGVAWLMKSTQAKSV